jgi:LmbE family N-acetylglucosaminyl deacetylase
MQLSSVASIRKTYDHVYVSPHMDDVALSCAGRIAAQRNAGESVLVVTVFTGDLSDEEKARDKIITEFANTQERRVEDRRAMDVLDVDFLWLDYLDQLYRHRQHRLAQVRYFFGQERALCGNVASAISQICQAAGAKNLYLPFGVGQHPDHRVVSETVAHLRASLGDRLSIHFYEDTPYIWVPHVLKYRMKALGVIPQATPAAGDLAEKKSLAQEVTETYRSVCRIHFLASILSHPMARLLLFLVVLGLFARYRLKRGPKGRSVIAVSPDICDTSPHFGRKMAAITAYDSQVNLLLKDFESFEANLARYSLSIGGAQGQCLERSWKIIAQEGE